MLADFINKVASQKWINNQMFLIISESEIVYLLNPNEHAGICLRDNVTVCTIRYVDILQRSPHGMKNKWKKTKSFEAQWVFPGCFPQPL